MKDNRTEKIKIESGSDGIVSSIPSKVHPWMQAPIRGLHPLFSGSFSQTHYFVSNSNHIYSVILSQYKTAMTSVFSPLLQGRWALKQKADGQGWRLPYNIWGLSNQQPFPIASISPIRIRY